MNIISKYLEKQKAIVLDGGLATELENSGYNLDTKLWSAQLLRENPDAIKNVHLSYLKAGADVITTASYQASLPGFIEAGFTEVEAVTLLKKSITIGHNAVEEFTVSSDFKNSDRLKPLVAASIGPYGAYLADGSEYRGDYGVTKDQLYDFHISRWEILNEMKPDLFAVETIPSYEEAEVILRLLEQTPDVNCWVSFSCKDEKHISDGTPLMDCAALFENRTQVSVIGINCTAPKFIPSLIDEIKQAVPDKEIAVYPNSGELWDGVNKKWLGLSEPLDCGTAAAQWYHQGARLIGGCCRMGPEQVAAIRVNLR